MSVDNYGPEAKVSSDGHRHDNHRHAGMRSHRRRAAEADDQLVDLLLNIGDVGG